MKIPFSDIAVWSDGRVLTDTGWSIGTGVDFKVPPKARISLMMVDEDTVTVQGTLSAICLSHCSRCGNIVEYTLDTAYDYVFRVGQDELLQQAEIECSDVDCQTVYVEEKEIDINVVLREQLILAVPDKLLCREDCKGLCQNCGSQFADSTCHCHNDVSDSPFAILKKLKK